MDSKEIVALVEDFLKLKPLINNNEKIEIVYNHFRVSIDIQWGGVWLHNVNNYKNVGLLNPSDMEYIKELIFQYKDSFSLEKSYQEFIQSELRTKKIKRILDE